VPTVGTRLRALRESVKLSQAKLGELAGLKQASVNRYEHDLAQASYEILLWYADHFDVSMDYIFARCDSPQGRKYENRPKIGDKNLRQFVEMCFDPASPMNEKLKETLLRLLEEGNA